MDTFHVASYFSGGEYFFLIRQLSIEVYCQLERMELADARGDDTAPPGMFRVEVRIPTSTSFCEHQIAALLTTKLDEKLASLADRLRPRFRDQQQNCGVPMFKSAFSIKYRKIYNLLVSLEVWPKASRCVKPCEYRSENFKGSQ